MLGLRSYVLHVQEYTLDLTHWSIREVLTSGYRPTCEYSLCSLVPAVIVVVIFL